MRCRVSAPETSDRSRFNYWIGLTLALKINPDALGATPRNYNSMPYNLQIKCINTHKSGEQLCAYPTESLDGLMHHGLAVIFPRSAPDTKEPSI